MENKKTIRRNHTTCLRAKQDIQLIDFLLYSMGGMSRQSVKQLLSHRQVKVNGEIQTRHDTPLHSGDEVVIDSAAAKIELRHPKLKIIYEDDYLIVVEKKRGLLTVPTTTGSHEVTCLSILKNYVRQANPRAGVFVVHRLDRETSGLLVFAKSQDLQNYMREYWRELVKSRTYIALAEGIFEQKEGKITTWLTEDPRTTMVYSSPYDDGGKIAITNYKVLRQSTDKQKEKTETAENNNQDIVETSLVELHLETGRTNQIRVHLASMGHPIVGDRKYGSMRPTKLDRLALHASELKFIHPVTEQVVTFRTPIPKEFRV